MCGFAGIVAKEDQETMKARVQAAAQMLTHRGPDSKGFWQCAADGVAFAHRRLSVIDLSASAAQPLHYADRYVLIYNGELYNYRELRKELEKNGLSFHSHSDTEVVVAAYAAWGEKCLQKFDGMFSFALWDQKEQTLFAARDRFGEKPFFFYFDEAQLVFASEMKALWAAGVPKKVNSSLLYNFLTIGYTANPYNPQETFYEAVHKLPTASFLTFRRATHQVTIEKYWQLNVEENKSIAEEEATAQLLQLLTESVSKRLRSDVAVGTSLSGGLDSSTIAALCSRATSATYTHQCFTAVFPGFDKNEEPWARQVAGQFGLQHHLVNVSEEDLLQQMDCLMQHQEEPIGSASALAQYNVYKAAREAGVTVLLDGQGADELLGGYHKYYKWYWQELYRRKALAKSGEWQAANQLGIKESFSLKNKAAALFPDFAAAMLQSSKTKTAAKHPHLHPDFAFAQKQNLYYSLPTTPDLNGALYYNTFVYGLEELLRMADRNSMAHSVEVRLPFLYHPLVEFLFSLPPHFKIRNGFTKWLLRNSMKSILPGEVVWRKDKVGFEPPQKKWMQNKDVQEKIRAGKEILVQQHILSPKALQEYKAVDAHAAEAFDWRYWSASYLL